MAARASSTSVITVGLVRVPVKLYVAASSSESIKFRMVTPEGNPIRQHYTDSISNKEYSFSDCNKGYEYKKGKYIVFTLDDLKSVENNKGTIEINNFVPEDAVDQVSIEKSYYLKPDKGGDRGFKLLSISMEKTHKVAIGQWFGGNKDHLILIRPYKGGLLLHVLFYKNEVRDYDDNCANLEFSDAEKSAAVDLIHKMSKLMFDAGDYRDSYPDRILTAINAKLMEQKGATNQLGNPGTDLLAALQNSAK